MKPQAFSGDAVLGRCEPIGGNPLLLVLLGFCAVAPAQAAALRDVTTLRGPMVYLHDLFDDAGANKDRILGRGPGPGGRIVIEARQLRAIAKQYGVGWDPVSSGDRAILEWPGRPLRRDEAVAAVKAALVTQGAAPDCDVEIPGFNPPIVPVSGPMAPVVTQLDYDQEMGRFSATLSVTGAGMEPISVRIGGQVADVVEVPVAVTRLPAGAIAGPGDVRMARVHVASVHADVARDVSMVIGMQLKRQLAPSTPIPVADLMRPTQVSRGDPVGLRLQIGDLSVTGQGLALETGAAGERIRVRNISSQAVIEAEIVGPGLVRVLPGTAPITARARSGVSATPGG